MVGRSIGAPVSGPVLRRTARALRRGGSACAPLGARCAGSQRPCRPTAPLPHCPQMYQLLRQGGVEVKRQRHIRQRSQRKHHHLAGVLRRHAHDELGGGAGRGVGLGGGGEGGGAAWARRRG